MLLIDADAHVIESEATWQFLDPAFHERRPIAVTVPEDTGFRAWNAFWLIDQKVRHFGATPATGKLARAKKFSLASQELTDVAARLADMDRLKIERQVLHPSFCLMTMTEDPELDAALRRSYNSFMSRQCLASNGRLFFDMVVPFRSPEVAVDEIRRVKAQGGAVAVLARGLEYDKPLDHPAFYPIYAEAERQNLAMVVHLGRGSPAIETMFEGQVRPVAEAKTFFPPRARRLVSTLVAQFGFYSVLESSLIEDFPKLRWVFLESGGSEFAISALSTIGRAGLADRRRFFDEGRVFMGCEPDEDINLVAAKIGAGAILVSSDMPHFDEAAHHDVADEFRARGDLPDALIARMFRDNPLRAFDFAGAAPTRAAAPRAKVALRAS